MQMQATMNSHTNNQLNHHFNNQENNEGIEIPYNSAVGNINGGNGVTNGYEFNFYNPSDDQSLDKKKFKNNISLSKQSLKNQLSLSSNMSSAKALGILATT